MRHPLIRLVILLLLLPYMLSVPYQFMRPPSTLMLYDLLQFKIPRRQWVPLSRISPNLKAAVVASEDGAFCEHWGLDFDQMERSFSRAQRNNRAIKATSTISQQLAKNLFLWHGRSWIRKGLEIPLTLWLELTWSKENILEAYLNIAEWGDGVYGAEAAAKFHFGTTAAALSAAQAAYLATSLPNPHERNAARPGPAQRAMASTIMMRMRYHGPDLSCIH
ncbi:MAG: monofunctional biosynthetic peptidoglycan transglycosylase [Alphaproteobacteria bacterium]|nr:monofunctional biosynthetic peptidoglycan transglycosylase [Alphaproteobacteria bacterium]